MRTTADLALIVALALYAAVANASDGPIEEIVVRGSVQGQQGALGSLTSLDREALQVARANHPNEALVRVPGVWISRGSGQEHLTAIRSGVLTGAGACGEFLILENGVPIRPAGFCNVNNLFELNTEQAAALEVVRGPASALFGGNALHGVVNAVTPREPSPLQLSFEGGPYDFFQGRVSVGSENFRLDAFSTHSNGYRDDTGYGQHKLNFTHQAEVGDWRVANSLAGTRLNQETGGFVRGFEAYKDDELRLTNPNPEAYRDAWSLRFASEWRRGGATLTPYLRRSKMEFLQHFLPGQPLERNEQTSVGLLGRLEGQRDNLRWSVGTQVEWMNGELFQFQDGPTEGSAFLRATRPQGLHYDYDVDGAMIAGFYDLGWRFADDWELVQSLRLERLAYDYANNGLDGNTRDDGTECGFGGCLYTRPADRDDTFTNTAGRVGLVWHASDAVEAFVLAGRGFRPPQATELYRLQNGQTITDLDSETLESFEVGMRANTARFSVDLAVYAERTDNLIFRDANGFNVSDGETNSRGIELGLTLVAGERHDIEFAGTYARHRYAFDRDIAQGEVIVDGNDVDTAPRWLGSARWAARFVDGLLSELELVRIGEHYIDAANSAEYDGHLVLNWRLVYDVTPRVRLFGRVMNVTDEQYADRADFAFGSYRYFPAMPRQLYLGFELSLGG